MKRREFITLLGGAAAAWPFAARAQQRALPVIGVLNNASQDDTFTAHNLQAFRKGLGETGYVEGRNVVIEYRWADGEYERFAPMVTDLVHRQVAVIVAGGGMASALAAKSATTTIPIVFSTGGDPVKFGLVSALNRPGGNLTGVTNLGNALAAKQLQLLRELVPKIDAIAFLVNPSNPNADADTKDVQAAASVLGQQIYVFQASTPSDIDAAFTKIVQRRVDGLLVAVDAFFNTRVSQLAALTLRHTLPAIYTNREFAVAGGLMSYGADVADGFRQMGVYTGRILKGEKPFDLPVQPTKVELIINLKTAKALGLTVSNQMQLLADEVIE